MTRDTDDELERATTILEQRARELARRPAEVSTSAPLELAVFTLLQKRWAVEIRHILEFTNLVSLTPVPGAPSPYVGITNNRGNVLALIDPVMLFGIEGGGMPNFAAVIVLGREAAELGLLVDRIEEIVTLTRDDIVATRPAEGMDIHHLLGVGPDGLVVMDGAALLDDPTLYVDQGKTKSN